MASSAASSSATTSDATPLRRSWSGGATERPVVDVDAGERPDGVGPADVRERVRRS